VVYVTDEEDARLTKLAILAFSLALSGGFTIVIFDEGISRWIKGPPPWERKQF
jgi:hypothetical protein